MISAVTRALSGHFKGKPPVVNEVVYQGSPREFLFVQQLNQEQSPDTRRFFNRSYFFDVRFHPDEKQVTQNKRVAELSEQLLECLELLQTDDQLIRAASIKLELQDGILHCFVDYPMRVALDPPKPPRMSELEHDENIKE